MISRKARSIFFYSTFSSRGIITSLKTATFLNSNSPTKILQAWEKMNPPPKDCTSWNSAISAHLRLCNFEEAYQMFMQMPNAQVSPSEVTFCTLLDKFTRYKSLRKASRSLLHLAKSKYALPWSESLAFYNCLVEIEFENPQEALDAYRRIYVHTRKPQSEYFQRLLIILGKSCCNAKNREQTGKFREILQIVLEDVTRLKVYVQSSVWFKLLNYLAVEENNANIVAMIWSQVSSVEEIDEGLLVKLLYFHAKKPERIGQSEEIFRRLIQIVGENGVKRHHIEPLLKNQQLHQEKRVFLQEWLKRLPL